MNYLRSNKGYALLITLSVIIFFTVLGMTMLALASNGTKKNEIRYDSVQATAQAEKGIDRIVTTINNELASGLGVAGIERGDFIKLLVNTLNDYMCTGGSHVIEDHDGQNGIYNVCIVKLKDSKDPISNLENPLRKIVTFNSIGQSGNSKKSLYTDIEIGANYVPEVLKYAIGTNDNKNGIKEPGEGNLLMHGAVSVTGDLKVDGDLLTFNKGYYANILENSVFPNIASFEQNRPPYIVLGGKSYTIANETILRNYYNTHKKMVAFSNNSNYEEKKLEKLFRGVPPTIVIRKPNHNPVGIENYKKQYKYAKSDAEFQLETDSSYTLNNYRDRFANRKVYPYYKYKKTWCLINCTVEGEVAAYTFTGQNNFGQFSTSGSVHLAPNSSTKVKEMYIDGDLTIGDMNVKSNQNKYSDVTLDGVIFVNGEVKVRGANLKSNVIIYANKGVDIQFSTLEGKPIAKGEEGTLILFAKESVVIKNISAGQNSPSRIKGFFYSEEELELYGVLSNMRIEGGLSGRSVVLNAIQNTSNSRLQVIYDPKIIERYTELQKEPIVTEINDPLIRSKELSND